MKFSFDRDAILKEIAIASEITSNRSPISILSNILLVSEKNSLTIKATDSSVNFTTVIPLDVQTEGSATIYCDKFMSILTSLPQGEIEFDQEDAKVTIKPLSKKIRFQLKSIASDKFPQITEHTNEQFFSLSAKSLKNMISKTIFSVSEDTHRYFMMGVYFAKKNNRLVMVSTDGRRLSFSSEEIDENVPDFPAAIVPTKILYVILKHASDEGEIHIAFNDKLMFVKFGKYEFSSSLLEGQFPNYEKVIPENQTFSFSVLKSDLDSALRRMTILIDKKVSRILFRITPGTLTIVSPETELGTADETIPCRYDGEETTIALNYLYILEPLKVISDERIVFEFTEAMKAITMRSENEKNSFHVIMPMNLN